ncbi:sulfite exporter TauE/SafE family protein [Sporosarcina jeotgali]|uniref:Probable membrane transporter protein n=1 Tax=Sporosarcina jeotgali TaxID=3020056 RepID=A0ABZ0KZQ5_9BACL|nr:sulfite exporter TauE/SafE family protein [Sporosarcina sp. B2O-1]WOV84822.1 sulfite exporter TauE/SafE family protein [Sporosarcina sp. B2O-1]
MEYILLFFIALVAMMLGTLAGGGGLITMPAMLLMGIPIHSVIGASKISTTFSSFTTFLTVLLKKEITLRESWWILPVSLTAGTLGGITATHIPESALYKLAIVLLVGAFFTSFLSKADFAGQATLQPSKTGVAGLVGIGLYDGLFGPGQGTLLLYLFNQLRISYMRSIGFVRLASFSSGLGAAISYIAMGKIIWPIAFVLVLGSLSGAQIGVRIAEKLNPQHVRILLRLVIVGLIVQLVVKAILK